MEFHINDSAFPLVHITYPELAKHEEIARYGKALATVMQRGRLVTVVDVRSVSVLRSGAEQRKYLAQQVDQATQANKGHLLAEAVVLNSKVLKAAYTAFGWMRRDQSYESRAFTELEPALRWAQSKISEHGLST